MRTSEVIRNTSETQIELSLNLDGKGTSQIDSGCGFLDHMLTLFARHGDFDLNVKCKGDMQVFLITSLVLILLLLKFALCNLIIYLIALLFL